MCHGTGAQCTSNSGHRTTAGTAASGGLYRTKELEPGDKAEHKDFPVAASGSHKGMREGFHSFPWELASSVNPRAGQS